MTIDEELDAYVEAVAANSPSTLALRPGRAENDELFSELPAELVSIWRWHDGQDAGDEFIPYARFLPLEEAIAEGTWRLESRRVIQHPDYRPGAFWLAFVSDGKIAHVIEYGPGINTRALVFDPSGFIDEYPVVPVPELLRLWRETTRSGGWSYSNGSWRIDYGKYPNLPTRPLLLG